MSVKKDFKAESTDNSLTSDSRTPACVKRCARARELKQTGSESQEAVAEGERRTDGGCPRVGTTH